jgi:hypothetical protein
MNQAARFQFERGSLAGFASSPAPARWWDGSELLAQHEEMTALLCYRLELPVDSTGMNGVAFALELSLHE